MIPTIQWCIDNFNTFNKKYFDNKLELPDFKIDITANGNELGSCSYSYGKADSRTRKITSLGKCTITITDQYDTDETFLQAILIHEMGHYYVNSVMGIYPKHAHGNEFTYALHKAEKDGWNEVALRTAKIPQGSTLTDNGQKLADKKERLKNDKISRPCVLGFLIYKDGHVFGFKTDFKYMKKIEERYINDRQWYEPKIIGIDWYETDNDKMKMERSQNAKLSGWNAKSLQDFLNDREKYYGKINLNKISNFRYSNIAENIIRQLVKETIGKIINTI